MRTGPVEKLPLIVDIRGDSREDGPGTRGVVFFKGCPLRCIFCQNPETQSPEAEISFSASACIGCGKCAGACPQGAADMDFPGRIHRDKCLRCGKCAELCPGDGLRVIGWAASPETVAETLLRNLPFYQHSGGGVTLSGGECTLYSGYLERLLILLKAAGVHVVLETCGFFEFDLFERKVRPYLDLVYFDLKLADDGAHRRFTGASNAIIRENFRRLLKNGEVEVHPRVPLIPGITTARDNLSSIVEFLREAGAGNVSLLPYNPLGMAMYPKLGRPKPPLPERFMTGDEERAIRELFESILRGDKDAGTAGQEVQHRPSSSPPLQEAVS